MKKYSAAEILQLALPGLPKTKVAVRQMAEREKWPYELATGVGGTRRLYEVPENYFARMTEAEAPNDPAARTEKTMFSASEIASLNHPELPHTTRGVQLMASREAWEFEVHTGIGGKRKLYKVPEKYITFIRPRPDAPTSAPSLAPVVATVAAGGRADPKILSWTVKALEEWAAVNNVQLDPERKGALIAVLYDYVTRGAGTDEVKTLLGAMK